MKNKPNYFDLSTREKRIYRARKKLGDEFFLEFFRVMRDYQSSLAMEIMVRSLDEGKSLDEIFYTGGQFGFLLRTTDEEENSIIIEFGYQAGPLAGDGNSYYIQFDKNGDFLINISGSWDS